MLFVVGPERRKAAGIVQAIVGGRSTRFPQAFPLFSFGVLPISDGLIDGNVIRPLRR
jgi:hypothetical protein